MNQNTGLEEVQDYSENEDIWLLTERLSQESFNGSDIMGVIWFLLWCTVNYSIVITGRKKI